MTYQNIYDATKVVLKGKFIALMLTLERKKSLKSVSLYLKKLEKEEQNKAKQVEEKKIIQIAELNEMKNKKTNEKINETKRCFFERSIKLTNSKNTKIREKTQSPTIEIKLDITCSY